MNIKSFSESVFTECPSRFTKAEKKVMQQKVRTAMLEAGWKESEVRVQRFKGLLGSQNIIIGDPEKAENLITGHYDTPASNGWMLASSRLFGQTGANFAFIAAIVAIMAVILPVFRAAVDFLRGNVLPGLGEAGQKAVLFITAMTPAILWFIFFVIMMVKKNPNNRNDNTSGALCVLDCAAMAAADPVLRQKCCFVLFDNEEVGLVGSAQFAKWCRKKGIKCDNKKVYNIDCVGVGEQLYAARTGSRTEIQRGMLERLRASGLDVKEKRSVMVYMSDHANFRHSYMLCYMSRSAAGAPYIPNIHTRKDTECDIDMVDGLAQRIIKAVSDDVSEQIA